MIKQAQELAPFWRQNYLSSFNLLQLNPTQDGEGRKKAPHPYQVFPCNF